YLSSLRESHTIPVTCCLSVPGPPPRSSLFPYTTLFRSDVALRTEAAHAVLIVDDQGPGIPPDKRNAMLEPFTRMDMSRNRSTGGDRKSTRLNSSHVSISYAVFCLKKKKVRIDRCARTQT